MSSPSTRSPVNRPGPLLLRRLLKLLLHLPARLVRGLRVEGAERLPQRRRPLVVVANHAAFIDSIYFILALRPRFTICGAKPRLFKSAPRRALMSLANILRVESHEQYLRDCRALLAAGEILLIYPEMGRFPDALGPFQTWAAEVALAGQVPILPCYLYGTTRHHRGGPRLIVGRELAPEGDPSTLTAEIRRAICALAPAEAGVVEGEA